MIVRLVLTVEGEGSVPVGASALETQAGQRDQTRSQEAPLPPVSDGGQLGAWRRLEKVALPVTCDEVFVGRKNSPG